MLTLEGKSVFNGITIGPVVLYKRTIHKVADQLVDDTETEVARFHTARLAAQNEIKSLYEKALTEVDEKTAEIFDVHQMMLDDPDYIETVENTIRTQKINAEYAVNAAADSFAEMFAAMEDAYMQERAADIRDISGKVLNALTGSNNMVTLTAPSIVAADDLAPSETLSLDKNNILAFITESGSTNSHTAILARTMGIPAIVGAGDTLLAHLHEKQTVIVDGFDGKIYIDPDVATLEAMTAKMNQDQKQKSLLAKLKGKPNATKSGRKIKLYANIGQPADLSAVLDNDAGGIGLFRSEFLYLGRDTFPSEEEQFTAYKTVLENMGGKEVVIRTLDIGADKKVGYFNLPAEENPALGYRAIRICLTRPEIFKTQLRAILRASAFGTALVMFPMITSVQEVRDAKMIVEEVKAELTTQKINFDKNIKIGIMIETPAAAIISDDLAKFVDFFSIGSNDLTQYTLAIDRQNTSLDHFFDAHHPAILKLIAYTAENAHNNGIWCGICGELGADKTLAEEFINMGIDELSVSPASILPLREKILSID
ncbi:MAG: phosphoenolpyruvate--protein phosphotransferase [Megasphaera sp.]|jgi:phosphotransferase system enzyme I (PtsI)|nr:phosphoenolpyruvate--protein phosphotransferase [Megasphaera sp.]MCI1823701.1 phosphoenolpyruvate--protein phosphotransferase [Megasphaera sp.]